MRSHIDDLLCITKGTLEDHLANLKWVLSRLQDTNLKVNACKSSFCETENEDLGYILSWDRIKLQHKKVQLICVLWPNYCKLWLSWIETYTTPGLIKITTSLNFRLNSKLNFDKKWHTLVIDLSKILKKLDFVRKVQYGHQLRLDVSVEPDTSEQHGTRANIDSVTASLAVQKLATGNQLLTKFKHLSRSHKNNSLKVQLDTGSDGDLMFHKQGTIKLFTTWIGRAKVLAYVN